MDRKRLETVRGLAMAPGAKRAWSPQPKIRGCPGLAFYAALLCLLVACAGLPKGETPGPEGEFDRLAGGGRCYFTADAALARPLLELLPLGLDDGETAEILSMTRTLAGAVYDGGERRFHVAAWGSYPGVKARLGLSLSSQWQGAKSAGRYKYWRSRQGNLSVYLDSRFALLSDADPFVPPGGTVPPASLPDIRAGAALAGWVREPSVPLNGLLGRMGIPLQVPAELLVFALYPAPGDSPEFTALLRIETPTSTQARGLAAMFNAARSRMAPPPAGADGFTALAFALLANPPETDGKALVLRSGPVPAETVALLFRIFSVY